MRQDVFEALEAAYDEPIRDPLWGHIYLTDALSRLTSSAAFMRLSRIQQLGPSHIVYPGATHTRFAHSIGVYHLARRLMRTLAERGADAWTSGTGIRSFLAAALLHDVGHFPYTHSLKELPLEEHEVLSGKIIQSELKDLVGACGADPYMCAAIVDTSLDCTKDPETAFYRKLLSGVLDPDKLDYLNRDARSCGVPYGAQDVDFTYSRLLPHPERGVDIDSKGIPNVEAILFAKYLMYRSVYWHRMVRSATSMMKKALKAGLDSAIIQKNELYGLDDQGLFSLLSERKHPLFILAEYVHNGELYLPLVEYSMDESQRGLKTRPEKLTEAESLIKDTLQSSLHRQIEDHELILDLPEPISFETGLYVSDEHHYFENSSTVFGHDTVQAFTASLRVIRIFAKADLAYRCNKNSTIVETLQNSCKCLDLW